MQARQCLALLLSMAAVGSTGAWARDIQCATTRQPAERVICDHAILNNEYDDIFAQQQALLSSGKLSPEQLARWRHSRNACTDVHCIDGVFVRWAVIARSVETTSRAAVAPVIASATAMTAVGPTSDAIALPASQGCILDAILWIEQAGEKWHRLPSTFPPTQTCYVKYCEWRRAGIVQRVMDTLDFSPSADTVMEACHDTTVATQL